MLSFFLLGTLVAAVNSYSVGQTTNKLRILDGENAVIASYPYQVSVEVLGIHVCGGSILSERYIVSAAHCIPPNSTALDLTIRAGSSVRGRSGTVYQANKIVLHEKFVHNSSSLPLYDVAVLRIKEEFKFDESRQPIRLFESGEAAPPGTGAVITGWGSTGRSVPEQLQAATVQILGKQACKEALGGKLGKGQICAATGFCEGDAGGPLTVDSRLAGIASGGSGCSHEEEPAVYTEVAAYHDWLVEHAELV